MTTSYNTIYAETVLGSPRARCARFGICETRALSPDAWAAFVPSSVRTVKARIWVDEMQQLYFVFRANSIAPIAREYFFATAFFKVDVAKKLPAKICKMLGIESFVIQPGLYEWQTQPGGDFLVCFGAQNSQYATAPKDDENGIELIRNSSSGLVVDYAATLPDSRIAC